jgi:hypothetical protein
MSLIFGITSFLLPDDFIKGFALVVSIGLEDAV